AFFPQNGGQAMEECEAPREISELETTVLRAGRSCHRCQKKNLRDFPQAPFLRCPTHRLATTATVHNEQISTVLGAVWEFLSREKARPRLFPKQKQQQQNNVNYRFKFC
ncbi:hypothetical protein BaRGS_00000660, partial [Batillaria attramentaria]